MTDTVGSVAGLHIDRSTLTAQQRLPVIGRHCHGGLPDLPGLIGTGPNPNAVVIFGANRYETAADVASVFTHVDPRAPLGIATGTSFADALTGGPSWP